MSEQTEHPCGCVSTDDGKYQPCLSCALHVAGTMLIAASVHVAKLKSDDPETVDGLCTKCSREPRYCKCT